jgi:hypothetical protein
MQGHVLRKECSRTYFHACCRLREAAVGALPKAGLQAEPITAPRAPVVDRACAPVPAGGLEPLVLASGVKRLRLIAA